jgi:microcystin-dependent protein
MGTVNVLTQEEMEAIRDDMIVGASIDASGYLILTQHDGSTVNAGYVKGSSTAEDTAPTPSTLLKRDNAGRGKVMAPVADDDIATKKTVDDSIAASIVENPLIPNNADLNTYVDTGKFSCTSNTIAAVAGSNYPEPYAGLLEVNRSVGGTATFVYQRYTSYQPRNTQWIRSLYNTTWSAWSQVADLKDVDDHTPTGSMVIWAKTTAPTGWLLCQGQTISRTTYADLYAAIGTTFGSGDGSTTFQLPNMKGRMVVGYDTGQSEFNVIGETGGEKAHTLTVAEMPSHNHGGATGSTLMAPLQAIAAGGTASTGPYARGTGTNSTQSMSGSDHTHTVASQGGGAAHNVLSPYITIGYIIKT